MRAKRIEVTLRVFIKESNWRTRYGERNWGSLSNSTQKFAQLKRNLKGEQKKILLIKG